MKKIIYFFILSFLSTSLFASGTKIIAVKFYKNKIGIYFTPKEIPQHKLFTLKKPYRLVLDMFNTQVYGKLNTKTSGIVDSFSYHSYHDKTRLVFSFKHIFHYKSKFNPRYIQFVITSIDTNKKKLKPRSAMIIIDPGHGGKDPGATGPRGIHEKNVVLAIAKYLQRDSRKMAGMHVDLTRNGDYFVTLRGRLRLARKDRADVFMAIHADSFPNKEARGSTVFALSEHGATSEAARWLAHSENRAVLGGAQFKDQSKNVRSVLLDLSQSVTIQNSLQFGLDVKNAIKKVTPLHSDKVEQAPFVVLKSPDIPSLLVETGFISNYKEERQLNSPQYQRKLARALANGIRKYLYQRPPRNSLMQWQQRGKLRYKVKPGNTSKGLANYFSVSEQSLLKLNHLTAKSKLHTGMMLKIPKSKRE